MSRFAEIYKNEVAPALMNKFNYKSTMQIPKFNKIVINVGAGDAKDNAKVIDSIIDEISMIAGQKAVPTYARKSVANFKLREGVKIGVKVTLRGERMYEFMDRLFTFALPRVRDFKGINPNGFDGRGNYAIGIPDQSIFPEIELDQIKRNIGFDIIFVTSATTNDEGRDLLAELGIPFRKPNKKTEENA